MRPPPPQRGENYSGLKGKAAATRERGKKEHRGGGANE